MKKRTVFLALGGVGAAVGAAFLWSSFFAPSAPAEARNAVIETSLFPLHVERLDHSSIVSHNLNRLRWGKGGSITALGENALVQNNVSIFHLDVEARALTRLEITPPDNGISAMRDHVGIRQFIKTDKPRVKVHQMYRQAILALEGGDKTTLLIAYNNWNAEGLCYNLRLARADFPASLSPLDWQATTADWRVIFESAPCIKLEGRARDFRGNQSGGRMAASEKKEGHVLLTVGDFGAWRGEEDHLILQNAESDYGRILEIDIETGKAARVSSGHRNPQGIARDAGGSLWSTEHGPRGGDELNRIEQGKNYGWPFVTYGTSYGLYHWPPSKSQGRHEGYEEPVYAFVPSVGLSNLAVIKDFAPEWEGDLLAASLKGQTLYRMRIVEGRVVLAEPIRLGARIRYVHNQGRGVILALDDERSVYIIRRGEVSDKERAAARLKAAPEIAGAAQAAWEGCVVCHGLGKGGSAGAPSIYGVLGRRIGGSDFENYSPAFASARGRWGRENLSVFLSDPAAMFEGTSMPDPLIDDPRVIEAIVDHLETLE